MSLREVVYQTGRTTRMLEHAVQLTLKGRAVYVAVASKTLAERLEAYRREKAVWSTSIQIVPYDELDINWETLTLRGAHKNCVLLIDHFVIEKKFFRLLKMQEQYDLDSRERMYWSNGGGAEVDTL